MRALAGALLLGFVLAFGPGVPANQYAFLVGVMIGLGLLLIVMSTFEDDR